jgi:hypothetical protein
MPLLKVAQTHSCFSLFPNGTYAFAKEQKKGWEDFWKEMDGDIDKLLDWAKKADIENPQDWVESLHLFLFSTFAGDVRLIKKAATSNFSTFLSKIVEEHVKDPKPNDWYYLKGVNKKKFLHVLEKAALYEKPTDAIKCIDSNMAEFGKKLYSEFLLAKTKYKKEMKSIASEMNKKAYEIEKAVLGKDLLDILNTGDKIIHAKHADQELEILDVIPEEEMLIVEDQNGNIGYVLDLWDVVQVV